VASSTANGDWCGAAGAAAALPAAPTAQAPETEIAAAGNASGDAPYAIRVAGVTKYYKIYDNFITGPIKERLLFWRAERYFNRFTALKNVSLDVRRGEVVGIIGPNGSGKTTLLKSIAGLLHIDAGEITVSGKITALLAQGVGVHPEFSGRENIYFGGLVQGMSRDEIRERTDAIIAFAELEDYIDRPFRTYSSGMRARLLFSISMSIDPDILIIDEALSAGDSYFVRKCRRRIREICDGGATVLFVSHDPTQVEELCDRGVLMLDGAIVDSGRPAEVMRHYYRWVFEKERGIAAAETSSDLLLLSGTGSIVLERIELKDGTGRATTGFYAGEPMLIRMHYRCADGGRHGVRFLCGILVRPDLRYVSEMDMSFYIECLTGRETDATVDLKAQGVVEFRLDPVLLINNTYSLWIKGYTLEDEFTVFCEYRDVAPFFVSRKAHSLSRGPIFWHPFSVRVTDA
jgi:lipopolysaccharide transport system ATP-binding protein